jgi:catechol 2,3-dioxygenase-like lactoylglutathione lyase family enzyme
MDGKRTLRYLRSRTCYEVATLEAAMAIEHSAVAIIPCTDLEKSQAFYERLGFDRASSADFPDYRILRDPGGACIHLTDIDPGWVTPDRNAYGLYFYSEDVDALAEKFDCTAEPKPWGVREFATFDPNGTLVRVGWPLS